MHYLQQRTVSDSKWYDPRTWGKKHLEVPHVWDMDVPLHPSELRDFMHDHCNQYGEWEKVK